MLGGLYLLLRFLKQRILLPHRGIVEMLHYQSFGPRKGIAVIKIFNDYMAVGVADQGISLLSKLDREVVEGELKARNTEDNRKLKSIWHSAKGMEQRDNR